MISRKGDFPAYNYFDESGKLVGAVRIDESEKKALIAGASEEVLKMCRAIVLDICGETGINYKLRQVGIR